MLKFIAIIWQCISFIWQYLRPIYKDLMLSIKEINDKDLGDEVSRKLVFQGITDRMQDRGLKKIPDSVLNCCIELSYQIFLWQRKP